MKNKGILQIGMLSLALFLASSSVLSAPLWYRDGGWHGGGWYGGAVVYGPPLYFNSRCNQIEVCNTDGFCWLESAC